MNLITSVGTFNISRPTSIESPKRMYLLIPNVSAEKVKGFDPAKATLDGAPLSGFDRVIAITQTQKGVRISLGGDA